MKDVKFSGKKNVFLNVRENDELHSFSSKLKWHSFLPKAWFLKKKLDVKEAVLHRFYCSTV